MERTHVLVVGAGMMGSGIAAMAALAGRPTLLVDTSLERATAGREKALACIRLRGENGLATHEEATAAAALLEPCGDLIAAVPRAFLVIEAIIEKLEVKQALFRQLDELLPAEIPICSNTSGLRITDISAGCTHAERMMTTHFWLPAHLVPLVEVVMSDRTEEVMAQKMLVELRSWKKTPVLVRRDLPGQLANRIFQAIIREAIDIVQSGLASAEDVDTAIAAGMAMRFPVWGPLMHLDAIGTDLGLSVQQTVLPSLCASKEAGAYIREMVENGDLGAKTGRGFYDWSKHDIQKAMQRRDDFIIETCKTLEKLSRQ